MSDRPVDDSAMNQGGADEPATPGTTPPVPPAVPPYADLPAPAPPGASAPPHAPYPTAAYPTTPDPAVPQGAPGQYGQGTSGRSTPPSGYAAPQGYAAPHAYAPPQGYAAPPQGYGPYTPQATAAPPRNGPTLGVVAFALAILAAFGATIVGSIAAYSIGLGTGQDIALDPTSIDFDWSILTPVRGAVLVAELAFWAGTILGIWALVQGIIATVKNRGRGWGVAALIIALIGPLAFAVGIQAFLAAGFAAGADVGG